MRRWVIGLAAMFMGTGCVFIPNPVAVCHSNEVGNAGNAPLKVGVASRADVLAHWGKPAFHSDHDRAFGYFFETNAGITIGMSGGPCVFGSIGIHQVVLDDDVWLAFDERGVLKRCDKHLYRNNWNWWTGREDVAVIWQRFVKSVPDTLAGPHDEEAKRGRS
jgi:hypothetical protein